MGRNIYLDNVELKEAKKMWQEEFEIYTSTEQVDVRDALGRVNAEPILSKLESPHYRASAMDGIAVKAEDTANASEREPIFLTTKQYELIDTGEPLAQEFDAVVMIENVNFNDKQARIEKPVVPGHNVRQAGESLKNNQLIIPAYKKITAFDIGLALEGAINRIEVYNRPKVKVIPTGTELVEFKPDPAPGEVIESNSYVLSNLAKSWGADSSRSAIVKDDYQLIKKELEFAVAENDFVAVIAGSSAGREDYTSDIIAELGEVIVHGVSIRPGGPVILGLIDGTPVMGVPGYPVAAALTFRLFAKEIISNLAGNKNLTEQSVEAKLAKRVVSKLGFREFLRIKLADFGGELKARPLTRSAGVMGSLAQADGLAQIGENSEGLNMDTEVEVELLRANIRPDKGLFISGSYNRKLDQLKAKYSEKGYELTLFEQGSQGGLVSLGRGESHLAGIYLPQDFADYDYLKNFVKEDFIILTLEEGIDLRQKSLKKENVINPKQEDLTGLKYELIIPTRLSEKRRVKELKRINIKAD